MRINCTIEGVTPLLFCKFTDAAQQSATGGAHASSSGGDRGTPREQAAQLLHTDEGGNVIMPQPNLMHSIVYGGNFFKLGRNKITTQRNSLLYAFVTMDQPYYKLEYNEDWTVDTRPVRIPATGGKILRHRPCFNDWRVAFGMELSEQEMGVKLLRDIVDAAGLKSGLGDFRPSTKGPFGKFKVTHWVVEPEPKA